MRYQVLKVLALTFALAALPSADTGVATESGASASYRIITWHNPVAEQELHALYLIELGDRQMVSRVLARTPDDRHVLLRQTLEASSGICTTELIDQATGWRAQLETHSGIGRPTLSGFFRASEKELEAGEPVVVRLVVQGRTVFETSIPIDTASEMQRKFVERLAVEGMVEDVAGTVPEGLHPALLFLERSLSPNALASELGNPDNIAHGLRSIIDVLTGTLQIAGTEATRVIEHRWPMEVGPAHRGWEVESQELRDLLAEFEGVALPADR